MKKEEKMGICPMCGDPNSQLVAYCHRCKYRLPWANQIEGFSTLPVAVEENLILDKILKRWGLLPTSNLVCRYCNASIEVDTKQCEHCEEWLVSAAQTAKLDPWSSDYDEKNIDRVDIINLRQGCFSIIIFFVVSLVFLMQLKTTHFQSL